MIVSEGSAHLFDEVSEIKKHLQKAQALWVVARVHVGSSAIRAAAISADRVVAVEVKAEVTAALAKLAAKDDELREVESDVAELRR